MGGQQPRGAPGKLEQLAEQKFGKDNLKPRERDLMRAAPKSPQESNCAECGPTLADKNNDPSKADKEWGPEHEIRAAVIRWLCVDEKAKHEVDPKGLQVYGAKINGSLDLSFVIVPFPLVLQHCRLREEAVLHDAKLPSLDLQGSWVQAITADRLDVKGNVFLRSRFRAEGEVRLLGAKIGGDLDCENGTFVNPSGNALSADGITVHGNVMLRGKIMSHGDVMSPGEEFRAEGEVRLLGAQIEGDLDCENGTFVNPSGNALSADGINVHGNVFLVNWFRAQGEVRLPGAQIGGDLECTDSTFSKLNAQSSTVKGTFWWQGLKDPYGAALDLKNASVGSMGDDKKSWPTKGRLFLDGFVYGRISNGPTDAETRLDWLARQYPDDWPARKYRFAPQPYLQLAKVLKESGGEDGAVTVLKEMECLRRKQEDHNPFTQAWSALFRVTVGYGYNPRWAIYEILGVSAIGWIIYRRSYLAGSIAPTEKDAYESFQRDGEPPPHYTPFAPLVYSVENSLPLVKLGQEDTWHPEPASESPLLQWSSWPTRCAAPRTWTRFQGLQRRLILWGLQRDSDPKGKLSWLQRILVYYGLQPHPDREAERSRPSRWFTSPRFVRWFLWIHILLGWLLATLFLAGVTGIVRKD